MTFISTRLIINFHPSRTYEYCRALKLRFSEQPLLRRKSSFVEHFFFHPPFYELEIEVLRDQIQSANYELLLSQGNRMKAGWSEEREMQILALHIWSNSVTIAKNWDIFGAASHQRILTRQMSSSPWSSKTTQWNSTGSPRNALTLCRRTSSTSGEQQVCAALGKFTATFEKWQQKTKNANFSCLRDRKVLKITGSGDFPSEVLKLITWFQMITFKWQKMIKFLIKFARRLCRVIVKKCWKQR